MSWKRYPPKVINYSKLAELKIVREGKVTVFALLTLWLGIYELLIRFWSQRQCIASANNQHSKAIQQRLMLMIIVRQCSLWKVHSYCPRFIKTYTVLLVALAAPTALIWTQSKLVQELTGREQPPLPKKARVTVCISSLNWPATMPQKHQRQHRKEDTTTATLP